MSSVDVGQQAHKHQQTHPCRQTHTQHTPYTIAPKTHLLEKVQQVPVSVVGVVWQWRPLHAHRHLCQVLEPQQRHVPVLPQQHAGQQLQPVGGRLGHLLARGTLLGVAAVEVGAQHLQQRGQACGSRIVECGAKGVSWGWWSGGV